jgi:hypothetical protein
MASPTRIVLAATELEGSYEPVEHRPDGSLVLGPVGETLSDVLREAADEVFVAGELAARLQRVAANEDDLPPDRAA